jgi:chromosome partitioning protein
MTSRPNGLPTLSVSNLKGGAAKTVSSIVLTEVMALAGANVLLVDLDPQGTGSAWLAGRSESATKLLTGGFDPGEDIDVAIGPPGLDSDQGTLDVLRTSDLSQRLEKLWRGAEGGYDIAVVDTPPQAGSLVTASFLSTAGVLVPVAAGRGAVDGLQHVLQYTRRIGGAEVRAAFACNVDARTYLDKQVAEKLVDQLGQISEGGRACQHYVRSTVSVREAEAASEPLGTYAGNSTAWIDYMAIARELHMSGVIPVGPSKERIQNPARLDQDETT